MILWILAAVLTAASVTALILPLARGRDGEDDRLAGDRAIYRDQIDEIERDRGRGLLNAAEAEAARTEVARRLLSVDRQAARNRTGSAGTFRPAPMLTVLLIVAVPVATLGLYLALGAPEIPSQPLAQRDTAERAAQIARIEATEELARTLADRPDDLPGWITLGRAYADLNRWTDAASAFGRAVGLSGGDPIVVGAYATALVNASDGTVTEVAATAFRQILDARPGDARARFYLALADAQAGDGQAAVDAWVALLAETPADAPLVPVLRAQIEETASLMGIDVPDLATAPAQSVDPGIPEVDPQQVEALAGLPQEDRAAAIAGMVEGLAQRLEDNPDDLAGWVRLARSYSVMGEREAAADALGRAAALAPDDAAVLGAHADALLAAYPDELPPAFFATIEQLHALDPADPRALWVLGMRAAEAGDAERARTLLERLRDQLAPDSEEFAIVDARLRALATN